MCGICVGCAQQVSYVWDMCGLCPAGELCVGIVRQVSYVLDMCGKCPAGELCAGNVLKSVWELPDG